MIYFGFAKDIHNIEKKQNKPLILGGFNIKNNEYSIIAHSDGDIILHAISSAILGALSRSVTIGELFPDNDEKNKGLSSVVIIDKVLDILKSEDKVVNNIDLTIVCEHIILKKYLNSIKNSLSKILKNKNIGIKATRFENQKNMQIECYCVVSLINLKKNI